MPDGSISAATSRRSGQGNLLPRPPWSLRPVVRVSV